MAFSVENKGHGISVACSERRNERPLSREEARHNMTEYHEKWEEIPAATRDEHRALKSLQEELEAVDWYNQRAAVTADAGLRAVLEHNRDEEMEHAAMLLEWLRRHMDGWDEHLETYLFTEGAIDEIEEREQAGGAEGSDDGLSGASTSLGLGGMKGDD